jgi:AAA15 family ATPase/GTPase
MFRALSILICVDYAVLASRPSCILIDDIGEGLDFDRSCSLIRVLVDRAKSSEIQLVMTTNDRFVMNTVPLENWSVIQRRGGDCNVRNYRNAQKEFDEFKFTGLNNFDFLALDYLGAEKASQG